MARRRVLVRAAAVLGLCSAASAQAPAPTAPIFDATARLVLVDLVVIDKQQRPVLDLTDRDFRVFEDGVPREIVSFAAFGRVSAAASAQAAAVGPAAHASLAFVQASTVLLIDEAHLSPMEAARLGPALDQVLRGLHERRGWLLVLAPWSNIAFAGRLPEDAAKLAEAAASVRGRRFPQISRYPMTDSEALDIERGDPLALRRLVARFQALNVGMPRETEALVRMRAIELADAARGRRRDVFEAIRIGFEWLARQPGRHSLILVSSGFPNEPGDHRREVVINDSLRVNAPIHFLDASSVSPFDAFQTIAYRQALPVEARVSPFEAADASAGSELLSAGTGGLRVALSDLASGLQRILDTTRSYYVLGYEPVPRGKPGFRKIKVSVRGKGLKVVARRGYFEEAEPGPAPGAPRH